MEGGGGGGTGGKERANDLARVDDRMETGDRLDGSEEKTRRREEERDM